MNQIAWARSVNCTTIVWLVVFFIGLFAFDSDLFGFNEPLIDFPSEWKPAWELISWVIWGIFVVDVYFKYRDSENWKSFLKNHWFDIILLIPFFRILRILRLFRLLKTMKLFKVGLSGFKAYKKSKNMKK
tara:strand:- start:16 stop:405 length:390 start_codon:yes stop_codon:yes gene_type:complete